MEAFWDRVKELLSEAVGRFRNPLIFTFFAVWFYYHWHFLYMLFAAEETIPAAVRADYFRQYTIDNGWRGMVGKPIGWAILSLASFYILGVLAQTIQLFLGKWLPSSLFGKIDKRKYELRSVSASLEKQVTISKERELSSKNKLDQMTSEMEKLSETYETRRTESNLEIGKLTAENKDMQTEINLLKVGLERGNALDEVVADLRKQLMQSEEKFAAATTRINDLVGEIHKLNATEQNTKVLQRHIDDLEVESQMRLFANHDIGTINTKINSVFPENSSWKITIWDRSPGLRSSVVKITVKNNAFVHENELNKWIIFDFRYNINNKTITFVRSDFPKSNSRLQVRLVVQENNTLTGYEGDNTRVTYTRLTY